MLTERAKLLEAARYYDGLAKEAERNAKRFAISARRFTEAADEKRRLATQLIDEVMK